MAFKHRNRTFRSIPVKVSKGVTIHYRKRNPAKAQCAECGKELHGVPHVTPGVMRNMPKTKKRPERPYGGVLCSACMREMMLSKARS